MCCTKRFYGQDAEVVVLKLLRRNRKTEYGLLIKFEDAGSGSIPVICLKGYYREYCHCGNLEKCIGEIIEKREEQRCR